MAARENAGYAPEELAQLLGINAKTLWQYEQYRRRPNCAVLKRIAALLKCDIADLIDGGRES